jgi:NAD(P)-dependent dehydrogenase (short-subunit alcohol dehydrogenase family)
MDLKLAGKTALITGASKGIGRAAADALAAEGCHLVLVARSAGDLAQVKASLARNPNVSVEIVPADLSDSRNVTRLAKDFLHIDILVNNAGAIPGGQLLDVDEATWRAAWDLKVFGYINMCRAFYALMKSRRAGVIVNVAGNAALTAFTQSLGSISVRDGVRVVAVSPGPVATERLVNLMRKKAQDRTGNAENWRDLFKPLPFGRAATAEEIGAAVAFLASEHSGYTSGSVAVIDAGLSARAQSF